MSQYLQHERRRRRARARSRARRRGGRGATRERYEPRGQAGSAKRPLGVGGANTWFADAPDVNAAMSVWMSQYTLHHAGLSKRTLRDCPSRVLAEVEAPRRRDAEHVVVDGVAVRELDRGAGLEGDHARHEALALLLEGRVRPGRGRDGHARGQALEPDHRLVDAADGLGRGRGGQRVGVARIGVRPRRVRGAGTDELDHAANHAGRGGRRGAGEHDGGQGRRHDQRADEGETVHWGVIGAPDKDLSPRRAGVRAGGGAYFASSPRVASAMRSYAASSNMPTWRATTRPCASSSRTCATSPPGWFIRFFHALTSS